jgi:hypothetical protein
MEEYLKIINTINKNKEKYNIKEVNASEYKTS